MKTLFMSILTIIAMMIPCVRVVHAATMCIQNDTTMVVLDPIINGTDNGSDTTGKTWSTQFSYGIISGIAGCYQEAPSTSGQSGISYIGYIPSGQTAISVYSSGLHCYCKMLHPVQSLWVYSGHSDGYNCSTTCAPNCASKFASYLYLRRQIFGSVGSN